MLLNYVWHKLGVTEITHTTEQWTKKSKRKDLALKP